MRRKQPAERAIALDPNFAEAYAGLGNSARVSRADTRSAVALYTRAYRLDPQFDMALHFMGRALLALDRFDEAETAFKRRLTLSPHSDMSRFYLACLLRTDRAALRRRADLGRAASGSTRFFSVSAFAVDSLPYADPSWFERLLDGLRQAGIDPN